MTREEAFRLAFYLAREWFRETRPAVEYTRAISGYPFYKHKRVS